MKFWAVLFALAASKTAIAVLNPISVTGDTAVHDPTMCKDTNGKYWLFSTGTGIEIRTSTDRVAWTRVGLVWPNGAPSATNTFTGTTNGVLWAPDCQVANGKFRLFYAASSFGSNVSGIFYATSTTGLPGSWTDGGLVTSTSASSNYNAIDPNLLMDSNGNWYLSLGSFWSGIKLMSVNSDGTLKSSTVTSIAERASPDAMEASVIFQYNGYYYLFTSWDNCCKGTSSTYNIRVGRATSVSGTYYDSAGVSLLNGGGTQVLATHDSIYGPGGQDIFVDTDGPILVYHYYTSTGSYLGLNHLDFSSGWPVLSSSGTTTTTTTKPTTTTKAMTTTTQASTTTTKASTTTAKASTTTTATASGATQSHYGQCGGTGYTGPTNCTPYTCVFSNAFYSQCL